jgi:uncharacterized membrane protein YphA (DoxX/SURF4 family)
MNKLQLAARILLGAIFVIFGANGFLHFLPMPAPPAAAGAFLGALAATGYMFPVIKSIEILSGLLLLSGFAVPLALVLLAPIVINIFLYHTILDPAGAALPIVIVALGLFLAWTVREKFQPLFQR